MDPLLLVAVAAAAVLTIAALTIRRSARAARRELPEQPRANAPVATALVTAPVALSAETTTEIDRLVEAGQKIQAIKIYRDRTGAGLREAKDAIDRWAVSTVGPPAAIAQPVAGMSPSTVRAALPAQVAADIDALVMRDQKIAAIKALREHSALRLAEAKGVIDAWPPSHSL